MAATASMGRICSRIGSNHGSRTTVDSVIFDSRCSCTEGAAGSLNQRQRKCVNITVLLQLPRFRFGSLEDAPELPPRVYRERPSPVSQPTRDVEPQNVEHSKSADSY